MIPSPDAAFDAISSKLRLPFSTGAVVDKLVGGRVGDLGKRSLYLMLSAWDKTGGGPFAPAALDRVGFERAIRLVQDAFIAKLFDRVLRAVGADQVSLRASLCASQLVGIATMRYIARLEPLASTDLDTLVAAMAPAFQHYITGPLDTPVPGV